VPAAIGTVIVHKNSQLAHGDEPHRLLNHLGERRAAKRIFAGLEKVLLMGERLTPDLKGGATTSQFGDAIIREIER
jgi:isocitrate/isopropylmalate dehydrogenase